jgi:hypothetical protein
MQWCGYAAVVEAQLLAGCAKQVLAGIAAQGGMWSGVVRAERRAPQVCCCAINIILQDNGTHAAHHILVCSQICSAVRADKILFFGMLCAFCMPAGQLAAGSISNAHGPQLV